MPEFNWIVAAILAVCGGITAIGGAAAVVINAVKALRRPNDQQNEILADHEKRLSAMERKSEKNESDMGRIDGISRALLRGMVALLSPGIDSDSRTVKEQAYKDLTSYLIEKKD